jgi:G3E family GTPase
VNAAPNAPGAAARRVVQPLLPVLVLTGFLGSGKTTLLNGLLRQPAFARTLVLINEFGSVSIDHDLVVASRDETVIELPNGCICCSLRGDLVRTLRDATGRFAREGRPWFDRVVIETTGLADPTPILGTLMTHGALHAMATTRSSGSTRRCARWRWPTCCSSPSSTS